MIKEAPIVGQYKFIEAKREKVLKEMDRLAQVGWRVQSFGMSTMGDWYALMTILITA